MRIPTWVAIATMLSPVSGIGGSPSTPSEASRPRKPCFAGALRKCLGRWFVRGGGLGVIRAPITRFGNPALKVCGTTNGLIVRSALRVNSIEVSDARGAGEHSANLAHDSRLRAPDKVLLMM